MAMARVRVIETGMGDRKGVGIEWKMKMSG